MLTTRERELLAWIEDDPMISQQSLAKLAGITRSSVAVHISNLMKKGYIQGKGYVVRKSPYVAVVGGANMDIIGNVSTGFTMMDSNPGHINVAPGGVARNQAHYLRLLDVSVKLITILGDDLYGDSIRQQCRDLGIDLNETIVMPHSRTSTYLSILDENGKMQAGVSDMALYDNLTPEMLHARLGILNKAEVCAVDTNITQQALEYLADKLTTPLFIETISKAKIARIKNILGKIDTIKTDQTELPYLLGYDIDDERSIGKAIDELLDKGVKRVFLHLPYENSVVCANAHERRRLSYSSSGVTYKNGARDGFMAAMIWAFLHGLGFDETCQVGVAAANFCVSGSQVVNENINVDYLLEAIGQ